MVFTLEDFVGDWRQTAGYNLDQVLEQGGVSSLFQNLGVSVTPIQRIVLSGENGLKIDIHVIIPYEGLSGDQMGQIEKIFKVVYPVDDHHFKVILHYGTLVIDGVTPNMIDYFGRPYEGIAVFDGKKITVTGTLWNGNKIIDERLINPDGSLLFRVTINGVTGWRLCERILAGSSGPTSGPAGCQVLWGVNQWNTGFTANVTVKNTSSAPVDGWTLTFSFPSGQQVTQAWSSTVTQSGSAVTVRNAPWNGSIPAGGTAQFGFNGSHTGTNAAPTAFSLNGTPCTVG
nr:NanoLuc luciferase CBM [Synthetic phage]